MDIDWKHLAKTDGYKSLKAAYIKSVMDAEKSRARGHRPMRDKAEFLELFNWVIARAKHYAHHTSKPIDTVLTEWESKRDYWWLNYYQDCRQPKFHSNSKKPISMGGMRKLITLDGFYRNDKKAKARRIVDCISREQKKNSSKVKQRWSMDRKARYKRHR